MDKVKDALHIGRKNKDKEAAGESGFGNEHDADLAGRESYDSELEGMTPDERVKYLKEYDHAEKSGEPKKGSFLDKLIARGNKRTEDQIREEQERELAEKAKTRQASEGVIR